MRAIILTAACVAGLTFSASTATAGSFGIGFYSPRPVVVVRPAPVYYPPVYRPYYPPVYRPVPLYVPPVQVAPIYVGPRPVYYPPTYYGGPRYWR